MKLISCGACSFSLSYLFFLALFQTIREALDIKIEVNSKPQGWHCFFSTFFMFLGEIFGGCMHFIYFYLIKQKNTALDGFQANDDNVRVSKLELDSFELEKLKHRNNFFYFFSYFCLMATMDYVAFTLISLGDSSSNLKLSTKIWQIIFTSLFSYFILAYLVYRHHFLSMGVIIFGIAFNYIFIGAYEFNGWHGITEIMISYIILSMKNTLEKYVMKRFFCEPLKLLFYEGVGGIIISTLVNLIFAQTLDGNNAYFQMNLFTSQLRQFFYQKGMFYFVLFCNFVCSICINSFIFLINFSFTPTHLGIAYAFSTIFVFIAGFIKKEDQTLTPQIWAYFFSYLLLNIGSIIYNEIVILFFCNLNEYTKFEIHQRSKKEFSKNLDEMTRTLPQMQEQYLLN